MRNNVARVIGRYSFNSNSIRYNHDNYLRERNWLLICHTRLFKSAAKLLDLKNANETKNKLHFQYSIITNEYSLIGIMEFKSFTITIKLWLDDNGINLI